MTSTLIAELAIAALFLLVMAGVPISFSMVLVSFAAMYFIGDNFDIALNLLESAAYSGIRDYVFAVIPLFILMGAFMTNSRVAESLFSAINYSLKKIPAGLGIATVGANAFFAAVTGVSVASAAVFSTVAYPQMQRFGYDKKLSLGIVAGSSILGMLIPPSLLMILYGILTQVSIGSLFVAGLIPGLLLAAIYSVALFSTSFVRPDLVGIASANPNRFVVRARAKQAKQQAKEEAKQEAKVSTGLISIENSGQGSSAVKLRLPGVASQTAAIPLDEMPLKQAVLGALPVVGLVALVIGGIWGGLFSPTEASGVGAVGALLIALTMGMDRKKFLRSFQQTAISVGGILLLLVAAGLFSRMLATSGLVNQISSFMSGLEISTFAIMLLFIGILVVMGAILDSSSIILLAVPLMFPSVVALGIDPIWFGIVFIVAVEIGLLTPPFGMVPFAMNATLGKRAKAEEIFAGSFPFVLMMFGLLGLLLVFPDIVTWLPNLLR